MPIAFLILVLIGMVILYFLLAFIYRPLGKFFKRLFKDAVDEMTKED